MAILLSRGQTLAAHPDGCPNASAVVPYGHIQVCLPGEGVNTLPSKNIFQLSINFTNLTDLPTLNGSGAWAASAAKAKLTALAAGEVLIDMHDWFRSIPEATGPEPLIVATITRWQDWSPELLTQRLARIAALRRRVFMVSASGDFHDEWVDGPLLHANAMGEIQSYLTAGGDGILCLPLETKSDPPGHIAGDKLIALEDFGGEHSRRCLVAAMSSRLRQIVGRAPSDRPIFLYHWQLADFSLHTAVILVLVRLALGPQPLYLTATATPPPAWRRLAQHLGARWQSPNVQANALAGLASLLPKEQVRKVAECLNRLSAVIPDGLLSNRL